MAYLAINGYELPSPKRGVQPYRNYSGGCRP